MSINTLYALVGGVLLGGAVGLLAACIKHDKNLVDKPGRRSLLHLGLMLCIGIGFGCVILAFEARECPNCDIIVKSNYCEECGYQVRTNEYSKELHCFECGAVVDTDTNFCSHCGTPIKQ